MDDEDRLRYLMYVDEEDEIEVAEETPVPVIDIRDKARTIRLKGRDPDAVRDQSLRMTEHALEDLRKHIRRLDVMVRQLTSTVRRQHSDINELRRELDHKFDVRDS